ncbi:MAG: TAXI family TRAP transporter solute-binding subunit [Sphaerochaeta sp.]|jgi:TRAP transporter TAXI family solute receptor|nr:TAXI family TRAP transporter solute-binding subunit [Sphaerochaeta sp.]
MRKFVTVCLVLVVSMSVVFAAGASEAAKRPVELSIGTASLGGNFFTMGAAMASVISDTTDLKVTAQATNGSAYNVVAVSEKEVSIGMSQASVVASAVAGEEQFTDGAVTDIRTLFNYNSTPVHILVRKGFGASDVSQLAGARVECMTPGDGIESSALKFLPLLGVPIESVRLEYSGNRTQAASRLKTGQIDAIFDATGLGAAWMVDVIGNGSTFSLLSLSDAQIKVLANAYAEMTKLIIPAGTYVGQTQDVETVGYWTTVFCHEDLADDVAYEVTKSILEHKKELVAAHAFFKDLAPENVVDAVIAPLHPGAAKYYKEIKVL